MVTRRHVLLAAGGLGAAAVAGAAGWQLAPPGLRDRLGRAPDPYVPDAAEGQVRLETLPSRAMQGEVDLFTAVPAGHGNGAGLPVVVVMHGASASAASFRDYGFGRFVTATAEVGAPPFVLAGTSDGPAGWVPDGSGPDPQQMVLDELPGWLAQRGFDAGRRAMWGWSRGGYGVLRLAEGSPSWARAAALFSPAVVDGDEVFDGLASLAALPLGVWCGDDDPYLDGVRALVAALAVEPEVLTYAEGGHDRVFWNAHTVAALAWLAGHL